MAKISPVSIKYIIYAKFSAEGVIEKPDVIGAVFGQTEGLLGEDLEMRELQKQGKIGRIEVSLESKESKTLGEIEIPSALDKTETTIIAAALETIERIGPSDTRIEVEKIEDVRGNKREYIMERAKALMSKIHGESNMENMEEELRDSAKLARLQEYGTENLPAGDLSGEEVIVVEGRADVVNMLKKGIKNVIAMNGVYLPETIKELSNNKETTLFVDGDRGGQLIIKNVTGNAKIDYIAVAPDGKEVEELTSKEILQALRKKSKVGEYSKKGSRVYEEKEEKKEDIKIKKVTSKEKEKIKEVLGELVGTRGAILFDDELGVMKKIPISQLSSVRVNGSPYVVAINGTATPPVIKSAERLGCQNLMAKNFAYTDTYINLVSV